MERTKNGKSISIFCKKIQGAFLRFYFFERREREHECGRWSEKQTPC